MRLVVCVDRDDDLGRKAGVAGPVVGRAAVLEAAHRLGLADPEDSDTNAMFAAVRLHDELARLGDTCEVVVLTGSPKVGLLSDRTVAEQFDEVLRTTRATTAHLVSDGAEDEFLFPIIASRLRVDGVHRVYIRQNASIESTYYTVVRALKDPKLRAKTVLPFAIVMLTLGLAAASGFVWWGIIGLAVVLGVYLIFWTFDIDEALIEGVRSVSTDMRRGSAAFGFGLLAIALVGVGFLLGYNVYTGSTLPVIQRILGWLSAALIWWIVAGVVWESGRAIRWYQARTRWPRSYPIATTSIVGLGVLSYGIVFLVEYFEGYLAPFTLPLVVAITSLGLALLIAAGALQRYFSVRGTRATSDTSAA